MGAREPHDRGARVHHIDKGRFAARYGFANGDGNVVGRFDDQNVKRVLERDRRAFGQTQLGGRDREGVGRGDDGGGQRRLPGFNSFESDECGHQLGERGRVPGNAGLVFVEHLVGAHVDEQLGQRESLRNGDREGAQNQDTNG